MPVIDYPNPDRFVVGTVGEPGARTFFVQASQGSRVTSVSLEKQQVAVLAERLDALLDELQLAEVEGAAEPDDEPLNTPILDEFRVGTLSLSWDGVNGRIVVECQDFVAESDEWPVGPAAPETTVLRVAVTPAEARAFARRGHAAVAGGRPACPKCGDPMEAGHVCRVNGFHR